jgi:hypothetical protein
MEYNSDMKRNEIMLLAGKWMEVEIIMLRKIIQTEKNKYHMFSLICKIYSLKMNDRNIKQLLFRGG